MQGRDSQPGYGGRSGERAPLKVVQDGRSRDIGRRDLERRDIKRRDLERQQQKAGELAVSEGHAAAAESTPYGN